jgi:hypothetical protein
MAKKKPAKKKSATKAVPKVEPEGLQTGAYGIEELRQVVREVAKQEVYVTITVPRSTPNELVPIPSPAALRFIDFASTADAAFPKRDTFILEVGRKKYAWKT